MKSRPLPVWPVFLAVPRPLIRGRPTEAEAIFRRILAGGDGPAFGHITTEAELALRSSPARK